MKAGGATQAGSTGHNLPAKKYRCIVFLKINNVLTQVLIDTGATSSAVSAAMLQCIPNYKRFIHRKSAKICISVNGQSLKSIYTVNLPILLSNGRSIRQEFEVIEGLIHPALLGTDFLKRNEAKLDFSSDSLQLGKIKVKFEIADWSPPKPSHLVSLDDVVVPPNSISLVRADLAGADPRIRTDETKPECLLVGPVAQEDVLDPFLTSYSVIDPYGETIWVEVLNASKNPLHITQGRPVANIEGEDPTIKETGMSRNLDKMPSELLSNEEVEDRCDGLGNIFACEGRGDTSDKTGFVDPHFTKPFEDPLPSDPNSERGFGPGPKPPADIEMEEAVEESDTPFVPKGVLTKNGIIYLKPDVLAGLEPDEELGDKTEAIKGSEQKYEIKIDDTVFNEEEISEFESITTKYSDAIAKHTDDFGLTTLAYHYANLSSEIPVNAYNYRAPPPKVRAQIDIETDRLLAAGIVRESISPYSAPIVLVKKPDGSWRYCTDFRKLNRVTTKVHFPLPHITDSIRRFKNPKVFSSLDLLKGFFQIPVAESHRKFYGFSDGKRHLEYCRTPMGSKNSGATMAALMEVVFRGMPPEYFLSYLDDIIVCTPCVKSHLEMLEKVFAALQRAGLKVNPLKCQIGKSSIRALGFVLSDKGITPDPNNLKKVKDWPAPTNMKEARQFIGLASYYRSHIVGFAEIAVPLTNLIGKDKVWVWGEEEQTAFETLKEKLLSGTACQFPNYDSEFILKTDGSAYTVGAVLSQKDERGKEVMCACASQKLNSVEVKWAAFDKEYFALIWGVRQFSHYLKFARFTVITDSKPLTSAINMEAKNDATGKRTRWSIELQSYDFKLLYKKGKLHQDADALSRCPHADPPKECEDIMIAGAVDVSESAVAEAGTDETFVELLIAEQRKDPDLKELISKLEDMAETGDPGNAQAEVIGPRRLLDRDYAIIDQILYTVETDKTTGDRLAKITVPKALIGDFLKKSHGDLYSGHPGNKRTYDKLSKFAYWPRMRRDVENMVQSCYFCQAARPNQFKKMVPVKPQEAEFPLQFVQSDLVKFYPPSQGYSYVLVFEDRFTKFCVLYPIADKNTITVAKRFSNFVTRFGCPITWSTDNGGEFKSKVVDALCKVYGTRKRFSLAWHPQSNGQTERKNSTIIAQLSKRIAQYGSNWAAQLPYIEFCYNTTPHRATGFTPYRLMFGREARTPFMSQMPQVDVTGWDRESKSYFFQHQEKIRKAHEYAKVNHKKYREQMSRQTSKKGTQPPFTVGSQVWCLIPTELRHKLSVNYDGPWKVKESVGNTYLVERDGVEKRRPHSDLKVYLEPLYSNEGDGPIECEEKTGEFLQEEARKGYLSDNLRDWLSLAHLVSGGRVREENVQNRVDQPPIQHPRPQMQNPVTVDTLRQGGAIFEPEPARDPAAVDTLRQGGAIFEPGVVQVPETPVDVERPEADVVGDGPVEDTHPQELRGGEEGAEGPTIPLPNPDLTDPTPEQLRELKRLDFENRNRQITDLPPKRKSKWRK